MIIVLSSIVPKGAAMLRFRWAGCNCSSSRRATAFISAWA